MKVGGGEKVVDCALLLLPYGVAASEGWVLLFAAASMAMVSAMRDAMCPPAPEDAVAVKLLSVKQVSIEAAAEDVQ